MHHKEHGRKDAPSDKDAMDVDDESASDNEREPEVPTQSQPNQHTPPGDGSAGDEEVNMNGSVSAFAVMKKKPFKNFIKQQNTSHSRSLYDQLDSTHSFSFKFLSLTTHDARQTQNDFIR